MTSSTRVLEEVCDELIVEKMANVNDISPEASQSGQISAEEPFLGKMFASIDEAKVYYEEYEKQKGFSIRTRCTTKGKHRSDEVTGATFVCSREGKLPRKEVYIEEQESMIAEGSKEKNMKKKRLCSTVRIGCEAYMRVKMDYSTMRIMVTSFTDDHNHALVTPQKIKRMRPFRRMPQLVKQLAEAFEKENLPISKVPSLFSSEEDGINAKDCYNHLLKVRCTELQKGDAQATLTYFRRKQLENPQFYYAVQCDEEGRAVNFFWVDARSRYAYRCFGDVVTFDTTYKTNKYDLPFAPFTGVNHHYQSIQFGCALLCDETEDTFCWLFDTWLEAMGGQHPVSIITDSDLAMRGAIGKVFPNTRHRLCLWHIKKKFAEKLSHIYFKKSDFKKEMKRCIHWTYTVDDFEQQWQALINKYQLENNDWLHHLYEIRKAWVPVYNRQTFFAGMNTTGRSEGMNSFFDDYLRSTTTLTDFVKKYDKALNRIIRNEANEDFESEHKERIVENGNWLMHHAAQIYTRKIYVKLMGEWGEVYKWRVEEDERNHDWLYCHVKTRESVDAHPQHFVVQLSTDLTHGTCACKSFEFSGLICKHIMKVFQRFDVEKIPEAFVCQRWRKGANRIFRATDSTQRLGSCYGDESEVFRLNHLCQEMTRLACLSAPYVETYNVCLQGAHALSKEVEATISSVLGNRAASVVHSKVSSNIHEEISSQSLLQDPHVSQTKGRKKGKEKVQSSERIKSGIEIASGKNLRLCRSCKKMARHDSRNCPENPNKQNKGPIQSHIDEDDDDEDMEEDVDLSD